jgi:serine/threonine protein phosphatase PrpC
MYDKGSTVLLAIVTETEIIAANIGDSKLFGIKKDDGAVISLTKEHDLSQQSEVAEIMSKGGLIFKRGTQYRINGELNVSRSLGDKKHKQYMSAEPDLYRFDKSQFKKIMLTTDGFYKH